MTITEFLEARIAEDEARARGADTWHTVDCGVGLGYWALPDCQCDGPARAQAECAAKRAMLAKIPKLSDPYSTLGGTSEYVLRCMASVYSDHADYQEAWAIG